MKEPTKDLVDDLLSLAETWRTFDVHGGNQLQFLQQAVASRQLGGWVEVNLFQIFDLDDFEAQLVRSSSQLHRLLLNGLNLAQKLLNPLVFIMTAAVLWAATVYCAFPDSFDIASSNVFFLLVAGDTLLFGLLLIAITLQHGISIVYEEHIIQKAKVRRNYAAQVLRRASLLLAQERSAYKMQIVQQERAYMKTLLDRWEAQQSGFSQLLQQSITAVKFPKDLVSAAGRLGTALERIDTIEQNLTATMHLSAQITDDYDQSNEQLRVLIDTVDQVAVDFSQAIDRLQASEQQTQTLLDQLSEEGKQLSDTWKEGHQAWLKEIENTAEHTAGVLRAQGVEIRRTGAQVQEGLERVERAYNQLVDTFNTAYEAKVKKPSDM